MNLAISKDQIFDRSIPEPNSGCWIWMGSVVTGGYGRIKINRKAHLAHRVSYEVNVGPINDGAFVCHACDNRLCVNPDHLFLGSHLDNVEDMVGKKRHCHGIKHGMAKLTEDDVRAIRRRDSTIKGAAKKYGISARQVCLIRAGVRWSHLS